MRKTQEKLLEKGRKNGFSQAQINALSRDDIKVEYLSHMFKYFQAQKEFEVPQDTLAAEATRCFDYLIVKRNHNYIDNNAFEDLLNEMLPLTRKDTLCGVYNKFALYHAYKFTTKKILELTTQRNYIHNYSRSYQRTDYATFANLLYENVDIKALSIVMKHIVRHNSFPYRIIVNPTDYKSLQDDLVYNGMTSFAVFLAKENKLIDFSPIEESLDALYDYNTHHFIFKNEEFDEYFRAVGRGRYAVDEIKIASRKLSQYPFVEYMANFFAENGLKTNTNDSDVFYNRHTHQFFDDRNKDVYQQCSMLMKKSFRVPEPTWSLDASIGKNMFVSIKYKEYSEIQIANATFTKELVWAPTKERYTASIFITPDCKVFRTHESKGKKKNIPLTVVELLAYMQKDNLFGKTMRAIVDYFGQNNRFVYDVIKDCQEITCCMPITVNDMLSCYNKTHFFHTKFKSSVGLSVNWNKKNMNLSYMILKAYPKIEEGPGRRTILQLMDASLVPDMKIGAKLDDRIINFIVNVIERNILESEKRAAQNNIDEAMRAYRQEIDTEIQTAVLDDEKERWMVDRQNDELSMSNVRRDIWDYVHMCFQSKRKIHIDVRSVKQIINLHDDAAFGYDLNLYRKNTKTVNIPKDTKFKHLRDILPEDFEWIQSRKRLILETELQHHCVWSYANKITEDRCAIYSFVDVDGKYSYDGSQKRYTIEFNVDKDGEYGIVQVQGKYDRIHTEKMREYIQSILDENQKKSLSEAS